MIGARARGLRTTSAVRRQSHVCLRSEIGGKANRAGADDGSRGPPGGRARNRQGVISMKNKLFRLGVTVAMLAVLIESLGAPMKW
jgi:hypothetical protein